MNRKLLLLSNSTNAGEEYLAWPRMYIQDFCRQSGVKKILFIPFAGVNLSADGVEKSWDIYEKRVQTIFHSLDLELYSVHHEKKPLSVVHRAEAIAFGGGNTFHLVKLLHETGMMKTIRDRVLSGIPYMGWSAGANAACPTLRTTNDMPVSQPPSFGCLNLIPFQINPHFLDVNPAGHAGETREQRILEFLTLNRDIYVAGLREGCLLKLTNGKLELFGRHAMRLFRYGTIPRDLLPGEDLGFLL